MNQPARAFAVVALAVASHEHGRGIDVVGVASQQLLEAANQAMFEHRVEQGVAVETIRSPDKRSWCPMVTIGGKIGSICRGGAVVGPVVVKKRRATCRICLAALT